MPHPPHRSFRRYERMPRQSDFADALGIISLGLIGLACLAPAPATPPPAPLRRYLGIPSETFDFIAVTQQQDMWCWAATVQMLLGYYGIQLTQEQIVARVYGQPFNELGSDDAISASLNGWGRTAQGNHVVVESRVIAGPPAPDILFQELSKGRPVLLIFNAGFSVGHAVVVTAASAMSRQVVSLVYRDPAPTPDSLKNHGRVELSFEELAAFLPTIRSYWIVSVRQA
jgi:Papain-like cysteine protease AvrRpt2